MSLASGRESECLSASLSPQLRLLARLLTLSDGVLARDLEMASAEYRNCAGHKFRAGCLSMKWMGDSPLNRFRDKDLLLPLLL